LGRLEALRDRLPSLYRPDADDVDAEPRPLFPADILEVRGTDPIRFTIRPRGDGALFVDLKGVSPPPVREIRLAHGAVPGPGWALELHRLDEDGAMVPKAAVVADVRDSVAPLPQRFSAASFGLLLRRRSLLMLALVGAADALDRLGTDSALVMQAHWFPFADRALFDPFFLRGRELHDPPLGPAKAEDAEVLDFQYILDLGRLASLLSLPPWQPAGNGNGGGPSESVEAYRQRIRRIVTLYADGLGTVDALRRMTEAQLPVDLDAPLERRDRPFTIEENAPLAAVRVPVTTSGAPVDLVGPLMHWAVTNDGVAPVPLTVYVQAPSDTERAAASSDGSGPLDDTRAPLLERFDAAALEPAVGLAYTQTIPPGKTLRIRPAYASWLGRPDGVLVARSEPAAVPADPTAPGPWSPADGAPAGEVTALVRTSEQALWAAVAGGGVGSVWRHDGSTWAKAVEGPGTIHCLAEDGTDLLLGGEHGVMRMHRFPLGPTAFVADPVESVGDVRVNAFLHARDGTHWVGTATGLGRLGAGDGFEPFVLGKADTKTDVLGLADDANGAVIVGADRGLFQLQPASDAVYWYSGESPSDDDPEWQALVGGRFPTDDQVFLPSVTCAHRARDGSLWIGTVAGLARYVARPERGPLAFRTQLEAFPDLAPGRVHAIVEDERALLWFCTDRGLFRFDGRDLLQYRSDSDEWEQLGRADLLYEDGAPPRARGAWRFRRDDGLWQRFGRDLAVPDWVTFDAEPRSANEPEVRALEFTDGVAADLLDTWSADDFSSSGSTPVDAALFELRCKPPGYERIVSGGIPAMPRLPVGTSSWRYLALEPADLVEPSVLPAWTVEGRLLRDGTAPPDAEPDPGRWDETAPDADAGEFDEAVFAFPPAARVGFEWLPRRPLRVLTRLTKRPPHNELDPAVLDRVYEGLQQVRPSGVHAALAVDETIVRGGG
jgi:hypothetical protein